MWKKRERVRVAPLCCWHTRARACVYAVYLVTPGYLSFHRMAQCVVHVLSKAWLAARVSLRLARLPRTASSAQRLRSTRTLRSQKHIMFFNGPKTCLRAGITAGLDAAGNKTKAKPEAVAAFRASLTKLGDVYGNMRVLG
jgi:hypothetical protein